MKGFIYGEDKTITATTQVEGAYSFIPSTTSSPPRNSNTVVLRKILVRGTVWVSSHGPILTRPAITSIPYQVTVHMAKNPSAPPTVPTSLWGTTNPSASTNGVANQVQNPASDGQFYEVKSHRGNVSEPATQVYHVSPNNWYMSDGKLEHFEIVIDCDNVVRFLDGTATRSYINAPWIRFSAIGTAGRSVHFNYNVRYDYREVTWDTLEYV